jgi:phage replication initiation protein
VHLFYGGDYTNGTACIDINGSGCSLVSMRDAWHLVRAFLEVSGAKLTRVDTALDFPDGEFTIAQAKRAYLRDEFKAKGRGMSPKADCRGDWIGHHGAGRTLMVGKREHGKQARVYEKGKQLGNPESGWVRFEIEWLSKHRVLPYDMVTRPEGYFAGGYPVCSRLLQVGGVRIKTLRREWLYGVDVGKRNVRTQYGQMLYQLRSTYSSAEEMVNDLERPGCPKRLEKGALIESAQPALVTQENIDGNRIVVDNPAWHL